MEGITIVQEALVPPGGDPRDVFDFRMAQFYRRLAAYRKELERRAAEKNASQAAEQEQSAEAAD
jgi:hypothetical protein